MDIIHTSYDLLFTMANKPRGFAVIVKRELLFNPKLNVLTRHAPLTGSPGGPLIPIGPTAPGLPAEPGGP